MRHTIKDLAYTAGILDGEGTVYITGSKYHQLRVAVKMCDRKVVKWLHTNYGGSFCRANRPQRRPIYSWQLVSIDAKNFLLLVYPFLRVKKMVAKLGIQFQAPIVHRGCVKISNAECCRREKLRQRISEINY